jgi:predicted amidohydrolase YtcJ
MNHGTTEHAVLANEKGAQSFGIHAGNKAPRTNTCAPRRRSSQPKGLLKLLRRQDDYTKTQQYSDPGRGLKLNAPGSQNVRNH